ncbi:MAG: WcaF family extracellular polysaccharide biosynthesis acetyltransferase [Candidatus Omnitrophica bacterium]|nr:WcaF family extracellular polysaccharide biosynthesis acetyltransferase [Candidatus Omnitrophota bacterium]
MDLGQYEKKDVAGVPFLKVVLWYFLGAGLLRSGWLPFSGLKTACLRLFGATLGKRVVIKPGVRVKYPWKLKIGDHSWIGEDAWIDNLDRVSIGKNVCISQGVYLCTGNHDWSDPAFGLKTAPIVIEDQCWLAAKSVVGPGVTVGQGAVLALGGVTTKSLEPMKVYSGNPAQVVAERKAGPRS